MTTKYVARLDGTIVGKRTTQNRTYTHAVVVQDIEAVHRDAAYNYVATKTDRENFNYYTQVAAEGVEHEHVKIVPWRKAPDMEFLARCQASIEGGFDAFIARRRDHMIAAFENNKAKGGFDPFVATWCGRFELARKAAPTFTGATRKLVAIVPAEVAA